ncbi:hypothetical protein EMCG_04244 [[Emmonsia] crescens]|uniref:Uncharacterized protein n=1 Tax=[Emmonsia] crescens TaxID=73230 RepID=A0A0G2HSX7_9EURO|nr:hypothetical protein EMCG_04244 [Emmonsia crescens UAMH 3008]
MQRQAPPPLVSLRTSHDILSQPLPQILTREHYRTTSSALHASHYAKKLVKWNISIDVKQNTADIHLKKDPLDADVQIVLQNPFRLKAEHYLCGDEQSICGRYSHNALEPVTAVAYLHDLRIRFGDHKASQESQNPGTKQYIPDFAGMFCPAFDFPNLERLVKDNSEHQPQMRIVGEAKTHWKHNLIKFFNAATKEVKKDESYLRHALGQIAAYMHIFKMRFAFLTTYDFTIFLKQDFVGKDNEPVLCYTEPISAHSENKNTSSVRQYLYYLMICASRGDDFKFINPTPFEEWVTGDAADLQKHQDPTTPVTGHSLALDNFYQMTPAPRTETSESERMPLYATDSRDWYSTTLQYPRKRIYGSTTGPYIKINNQVISVELLGKAGSEVNNNQDPDDDDNSSGNDNGRGNPTRREHAPIKATAHNKLKLSGPAFKTSTEQSFNNRIRDVRSTSASTHTTTPVAQRDRHPIFSDRHSYMQESPSPSERFGSQQDRANRYEVHHSSPLGQPADPSQHLSSPSEEERARRKAEEKKKDKQNKLTAAASVDGKALDHRPRPKKDDDDEKEDRKSSSAKTTAAGTRLRRYNK